jgi:glycosyltransferase involved in cell wall biosynthesis
LTSLIKHNFLRTYQSIKSVLNNKDIIKKADYLYSVSDFYPDFIPALISKKINSKIKWIAGFYLFAPKPFAKDSPYKNTNFIKGLFYWLMQIPSYLIIKNVADIIFVTSKPDVKKFPKKPTFIIQGGVDTKPSEEYLNKKNHQSKKIYDAVFIGRLHYQKGVVGLIDIWNKVTKLNPKAKLAIIGDGELKSQVQEKIKKYKLKNNITLLGFMDGFKKYEIFKSSKIVVHPATYDSGGMAAAEAMAWGLPGVSYDLEALTTYYPKGMIKTKCFDQDEFARNIIKLLNNQKLYQKLSQDARQNILENWDWENKSNYIFKLSIK